jgi:cell division protein FtsB
VSAGAYRDRRYRARVGPRSHSRSRGTRIHWDKLGRVVLVLVVFAVLASYVRPAINLIGNWREAGATEQRLVELKQENQRLEQRAEGLKTPAAAVREARKLGLVAEGERAYKIEGLR